MEKFSFEKGTNALVAKLQIKPNYFARRAPFQDSPNWRKEAGQDAALLPRYREKSGSDSDIAKPTRSTQLGPPATSAFAPLSAGIADIKRALIRGP